MLKLLGINVYSFTQEAKKRDKDNVYKKISLLSLTI